jgi:Protein of unknown function (DUF2505)
MEDPMAEQLIRHVVACDTDTYFKCVFDEEYNRRLYLDVLKFRELKPLSQEDKPDTITRKLYLNPAKMDLPGPIAKVVGDLSWVEEGTYDKKTKRYRFKVTPGSNAEKTRIEGEIWCEDRGPKKVERVAKAIVEVKIFMVGGLIEKRILDDMKKSYDAAAKFTDEFVKEKGW